ncbi:DNA adenine methylase [Spirosoma gilvum]
MGFRYIGSKEKLSDIIISEIRSVNPRAEHVIDLMAGTGQFSLALREAGFRVSAVDVMTYSYHHLNVQLHLTQPPLFEGMEQISDFHNNNNFNLFSINNYEKTLNYLNRLTPVQGYFFNEFSLKGCPSNKTKPRQYFTPENASKIDAIRLKIKSLHKNNYVNDLEHSLLLHDLIMAANDIANIAGTYGHYLSKLVKRAETPINLTPTAFSRTGKTDEHKVYLGYAESIAPQLAADVCYIDPPYIKRQYAANYHILETLAREDEPEAIGESGLRPWRDQYSNFCSKVKIRDSFDAILKHIQCQDILISYSEDGLLPIADLTEFLTAYGTVKRKDVKYKRFKSNDSQKGSTLNEYLIHVRKH